MRATTVEEQEQIIDFAKRAARSFEISPGRRSFGDLTPGSLIAIRYGLCCDGVVVARLDDMIPISFARIIEVKNECSWLREQLGSGQPPGGVPDLC